MMRKKVAILVCLSMLCGTCFSACAPEAQADKSAKRAVVSIASVLNDLQTGGLGGLVTVNGITHGSSEEGFSFADEQKSDVVVDGYCCALADGFSGSEYYVEGVLDTTDISYEMGVGIVGLLVAHGGSAEKTLLQDTKMVVSLHEQNLIVSYGTGYKTSDTVSFTNWTQFFSEEELKTLDRSAMKLGVLRAADNDFAFFVNDRYVGGRKYNDFTTLAGTPYGDCGVGVMGAADADGISETVKNVRYTQNEGTMSAITAKLPKEKSMDLYLIAGQSNAAGSSKWTKDVMMSISDKTVYGNACVWYKGNPGSNVWTLAKAGQGSSVALMGAEVGMSAVLQDSVETTQTGERYVYDAAAGRYAGIIKRSVGGTSLFNNTEGLNAVEGNWYPPTNAEKNGYDYSEGSLTGGLYRKLVADTIAAVKDLKEMGFDRVNIKGMFWMQGEADRANYHTYRYVFQNFVSDLRRDLGEGITPMSGQDFSNMPIFVGEISATFDQADAVTVSYNMNFIQMQNELPSLIDHLVVLPTKDFALTALSEDGQHVVLGSDHYHFNQKDMYEIGTIVGASMVGYPSNGAAKTL